MNNENFNIAPNDENEEFTVEFGEVINDGGTHDYDELDNQPQINGHTLEGNKTGEQLGLQDKINDLNTIRSGATKGATAVQPEDLARIATTGSYNDSLDKPSVNNVALIGNISLDALGIQPKGNYALESEIPDVSNFITKDVNNLTNYTLKTNTGSLIDLEINDTTYVITLKLKNQDGTVISTDTIDLPLESVVVSGRYDNTTKKVILTLENGSEVDFSVADLVAGLQTEITSSNKLASNLVDDTNSGNKFVTTSEKQTWNNKLDQSDLTNYVKNTDYATAEKGGTIRTSNASGLGISNGNLYAVTKAYNTYSSASGNMFIGKGTLENVITGKGLVSNTDYATYSNGGVIKVDGAFSTFITDGKLKCTLKTYGDYQNLSSYAFISKGTLENVITYKADKISVVQTSTSTIEINPNTFYKFGEVASLNITLASITDNTIYNEYMFEFVSGTTATTLTLPSSIKWLETPTIDANKIYQCSIVDNVGLLVGVANV